MMKRIYFLTLILVMGVASAEDRFYCVPQQAFILGEDNAVLNEFKVQPCHKKLRVESQACKCAEENSKIIGPTSFDKRVARIDLIEKSKDLAKEKLENYLLSIVDQFIMMENKLDITSDAAKNCKLDRVIQETSSKCNSNSLLSSIQSKDSNFLKNIIQSAQCEMSAIAPKISKCPDSSKRLRNLDQSSCLSDFQVLQLRQEAIESELTLFADLIKKDGELKLYQNNAYTSLIMSSDKLRNELKRLLENSGLPDELGPEHNQLIANLINTNSYKKMMSGSVAEKCESDINNIVTLLCSPTEEFAKKNFQEIADLKPKKKSQSELPKGKSPKEDQREQFIQFQHSLKLYCDTRNEPRDEKLAKVKNDLKKFISVEDSNVEFGVSMQAQSNELCGLVDNINTWEDLEKLIADNNCSTITTENKAKCQMLMAYDKVSRKFLTDDKGEVGPFRKDWHQARETSEQLKIVYGGSQYVGDPNVDPEIEDPKVVTQNQSQNQTQNLNTNANAGQPTITIQNDNEPIIERKRVVIRKKTRIVKQSGPSGNGAVSNYVSPVVVNVQREIEEESGNSEIIAKTDREIQKRLDNVNKKLHDHKDKMIDELSDQIKRMNDIASQTININKDFIGSAIGNAGSNNVSNVGENNVNTVTGNDGSNFGSGRASAGNNGGSGNSSSTPNVGDVSSSTTDGPKAILSVNEKAEKTLDELEVVFDTGVNPYLSLLNPVDYTKVVDYLREQKPFILTKKFKQNGIEKVLSAKIEYDSSGKFKVTPINFLNRDNFLGQFEEDIQEAFKIVQIKSNNRSTL